MPERRTRVALDAMGGDRGPEVNVAGAIAAARELGSDVVLVGDEAVVRQQLAAQDTRGLALSIRHAPEAVEMGESPMAALRKKKHSSIRIGLELIKKGEADAFVSAGNTGAVMTTALVVLGTVAGVERPAIAIVVPTATDQAVLLDAGANVDCKARHLVQFAIMGHIYARDILRRPRPRVGLLSIGEEESKGNELTREVFKALEEEHALNFIGNVEGRDVFSGSADVVVCDGFIGNVALKISEGLVETIFQLLRHELKQGVRARLGSYLLVPTFRRFKRRIDSSEYGGAPLLGVNGVCMISHGRSTAKAIRNAIRAAEGCVDNKVIAHIREGVALG
ncbi:MAG TPA: phosphate acyltransferase PlsX [Candidatus Baltobacteraceae bacterium]|nr:phosphate acyltransferase PlsX [Candidatus Baltobacteraceae bacterium]